MKKRKTIILASISIGFALITTSAFSSYIISQQINKSVNINISDIEISNNQQKIISYLNNDKTLGLRGNDIVKDVYSVSMSFNNSEYTNRFNSSQLRNLYINSALKVSVTFSNQELFNYIINNNLLGFLNLSYDYTIINSNQELEYKTYYLNLDSSMNYLYYYGEEISDGVYLGSKDCLTYSNTTIDLIIPTALERCASYNDSNSKNFYLQKIYSDNSNVSPIWNFYINLNLGIIDEQCGYSKLFNMTNIGEIKIKLSFEDLREV